VGKEAVHGDRGKVIVENNDGEQDQDDHSSVFDPDKIGHAHVREGDVHGGRDELDVRKALQEEVGANDGAEQGDEGGRRHCQPDSGALMTPRIFSYCQTTSSEERIGRESGTVTGPPVAMKTSGER